MRLGYHLARYDLTTREKLIKGANTEILRAVPREKISNKRWGYLQEKWRTRGSQAMAPEKPLGTRPVEEEEISPSKIKQRCA